MDLKYTIEILTKDIQDIEKLVAGLQNSPDTSTLELDLALSKIRNLYDVLSSIRDDISLEYRATGRDTAMPPAAESEPAEPAPVAEEQIAAEEFPAPEPEIKAAPEPEPEASPESKVVPEPEAAPEPEVVTEPELEPPLEEKVESGEMSTRKHAEILADKFLSEASINENLAGSRENVLESKLAGKPIDSISKNIGINDRFMIIRELYEGDSEALGKLISDLDQAGTLDVALNLLDRAVGKHEGHEGINILKNLVRRRYIQ